MTLALLLFASGWWAHVEQLAAPEMDGRKAGTAGYDRAAAYVEGQFTAMGLATKRQPVTFRARTINEAESLVEFAGERLEFGRDVSLASRGVSGTTVEASAVFLGYGLVAPEAGIDELAGKDLKGKIAVILNGFPKSMPVPLAAHASSAAERWRRLREAGAIGMATIYNTNVADLPWERASEARTRPALQLAVPELVDTAGQQVALTISPAAADRILKGTGHTYAGLLALDKADKPLPRFELTGKFRVKSTFLEAESVSDNIMAILPGSSKPNEYVVFTAHLDHVGPEHPGVMDNAAGVASLLEVARAMKGRKLARSVAFVAVTGEESGLLGSRLFAARLPIEGRVVANLNTDMFLPIVPLKGITVLGLDESDLGDEFSVISREFGLTAERDPQPQRNSFVRSDQFSFIRRGIPSLAFKFHAAPGTPEGDIQKQWLTERYHGKKDDLSQPVNKEGADKFNEVMAAFLVRVANRAEAPRWKDTSFFRRYMK